MNQLPEKVKKYLDKHSFADYKPEWNYRKGIKNIVVIPAIAELGNFTALINSLNENDEKYFDQTLIIFVINNNKSSDDEVKLNNKKSIEFLRSIIFNHDNHSGQIFNKTKLNIGIIDAASEGKELPDESGGVGLARKIGMDIALNLFDYESSGKNILFCTDADVTLSKNYLSEIIQQFNNYNLNAAYTNFEHDINGDDEASAAIICYEIFLRYYVNGLRYANSHYAFHTIGSTIICDADAYIKVGGMNKKKAAEDFYFLEKLAKNYNIRRINSATVFPSNRSSWRVPFGTGQRVTRFLNGSRDEYLLYDPVVFDVLKSWLQLFFNFKDCSTTALLNDAKEIHPELYNFLIKQGFETQWENIIDHCKTDGQLARQKKYWFDGFRTLKLIHHLRDTAFPEINMFEALNNFFERLDVDFNLPDGLETLPDPDTQRSYLLKLRELEEHDFEKNLQMIK